MSDSEVQVGQTVQMDIRISGARGAEAPQEIVADGLQIHRTGTSQQFEMRNFTATSSVVYSYTVLPMKAGTLTIRHKRFVWAARKSKTPGLTLRVVDLPETPARMRDLVVCRLVVRRNGPGRSDYSEEGGLSRRIHSGGDRIGVDQRARFDPQALMQGPVLKSPGITFRKWEKPTEFSQIKNGRRESVWFKTAISPAKIDDSGGTKSVHAGARSSFATAPQPRDLWHG